MKYDGREIKAGDLTNEANTPLLAGQRPGRLELPVTGPTLAFRACQLGDKLTHRSIASQGKHNVPGVSCHII